MALLATLVAICCGKEQPAAGQTFEVVATTGNPAAAASPTPALPIAEVRKERGFDMLARELAYLGSLPPTDTHRVEVGGRQVKRTIDWLELRKVAVPQAVALLRPRLEAALAESPGEPPVAPVEPKLEAAPEVGGFYETDGTYLGVYESGSQQGAKIATATGPVVILHAKFPARVRRGSRVSGCGTLSGREEEIEVGGTWKNARFYWAASWDECRQAIAERKAARAARKIAYKEERKQYKLALAEYERALAEYHHRKANFAQLKQTAIAALPPLAVQAAAALQTARPPR